MPAKLDLYMQHNAKFSWHIFAVSEVAVFTMTSDDVGHSAARRHLEYHAFTRKLTVSSVATPLAICRLLSVVG